MAFYPQRYCRATITTLKRWFALPFTVWLKYNGSFFRLASIAGAVIQAIRKLDFEDGIMTGVQREVSNDLQCVCTKPVVKLAEPLGRAKTVGAVYPLGGC